MSYISVPPEVNSARPRYIRVAAIVIATIEGIRNICVAKEALKTSNFPQRVANKDIRS